MDEKETLKQMSLNMRKFRELKGLTREQFAERLGVDPYYWGTVERAERYINLPRLLQVCDIFGADITQFIPREETPAPVDELLQVQEMLRGLTKKQLAVVGKFIKDIVPHI